MPIKRTGNRVEVFMDGDINFSVGQRVENSRLKVAAISDFKPKEFDATKVEHLFGAEEEGNHIELVFATRQQAISMLYVIQSVLDGWDEDMRNVLPPLRKETKEDIKIKLEHMNRKTRDRLLNGNWKYTGKDDE